MKPKCPQCGDEATYQTPDGTWWDGNAHHWREPAKSDSPEKNLCPRRAELGNPSVFNLPTDDAWREENLKRTCSYCGSLHPDEFMARAEAGEELVPTDKDYKVYVGAARDKFYFQHLSTEQKQRFVDLLNSKRFTIGYPGSFYALPFFIKRGAS